MKPTIVFDKSFIQSLSVNESVLLDYMFTTNIPPVFMSETLADLEKELKRGRLPEQVVGNLAHKTPEANSHPNVHHAQLAYNNLLGKPVPMDGRIMLPGGKKIDLPDEKGVIYEQSPEAKAFLRWQQGQFLEVEREYAKGWRLMINQLHFDPVIKSLNSIGIRPGTVVSLLSAFEIADSVVNSGVHPQSNYDLALLVLNIPREHALPVLDRAQQFGNPPLSVLAPYASYYVKVELFFYIAIAARLLPPEKLTNRIDLSYLYYLPFCSVFVSGDKFHRTVVHLFLRNDQDFVWGNDLKAALSKLEQYYDALPDREKDLGLINFASAPPKHESTIISLLWDKHIPKWRKQREIQLTDEAKKYFVQRMNSIQDAEKVPLDETDSGQPFPILIKRKISRKKGNWYQVPKDLPDKGSS